MGKLRSQFESRSTSAAHRQIDVLNQTIAQAEQDPNLIERLHQFNDTIQRQLIELTDELAYTFFDAQRPSPTPGAELSGAAASTAQSGTQSQSQSQSQGASQSQSQGSS